MPTCIVPGCSNRSGEAHKGKIQKEIEKEKGVNITFHRLPLNPTKREQWLDNLKICTPRQKNPMVCSVHFKEAAFDRTSLSCVRLRETAIPYVVVPKDDEVLPHRAKVDTKSSQERMIQVTIPQEEAVPSEQAKIDDNTSLECIEEFIPTSMQESDDTAYEEPQLVEGWLTSVPSQPTRAFCMYCKKNLHAHRLSLLKHTCTMKHQRSALMHQNNVSVKNATTREGIAKIEAEQEDEPEEEDVRVMDASYFGQVKMLDREEDDEEIEYVVERLDMDDEEIEEEQRKSEQEQMEEEEEEEQEEEEEEIERENGIDYELSPEDEDVKPPLKKIKIEKNNEKCRDTLAEAMAHVRGEYMDENNEQVDMQLEMVVESEDTNPQEMQTMSIPSDARNNENDTLTKNIEENEEDSRRSNDEYDNDKCIERSSKHESDSNELTIGNEIVLLRSPSKLNPAYQINSSKASSSSTSESQQSLCNTVTIAPIQNKTITLTSHDGKTLTLMGSKFAPGTQYVLNKMKGKFPTLFMADKKPIVVSNQSGSSQKCIQPKTSRLLQSVPSFAVAGTSQSPKKHVILKSIKPSSLKKPRISTHVLDISKGLPVGGLQVSLYKLMDGRWTFLNESNTTPNGRCIDLVDSNKCNFTAGRYKIHFDVDKYFTLRRIETMYPFIEIVFDVKNPTGHYHIPVLLSPFSFMTYRDSER